MKYYDIIIIGAGPVGSRAAYKLASLGYEVAVLEKHSTIGHKQSCTGIIGKECMELAEPDKNCILREARSARLYSPSGEYIRVEQEDVQAYIIDRLAFDRSLATNAKACGANYHLSSQVNVLNVTSDGVEIKAGKRIFFAKSAIIANGFSSKLTTMLGLGKIKKNIAGAQTEVATERSSEVEVYFSQKVAPGFFAWLVPVSEKKARVGLFAKENPSHHLRTLLAKLESHGKILSTTNEIHHGGIPLKPLAKTYSDRILVVGDAAGQVKPTTGGGIYYGLLCADIASSTLNNAFISNDLSRKNLSQYEKQWKSLLSRELRIDYFARAVYNRLSDKRISTIFKVVEQNNIHQEILKSSYKSFDWHGELVLDSLKQLGPWRYLFLNYLPDYMRRSFQNDR